MNTLFPNRFTIERLSSSESEARQNVVSPFCSISFFIRSINKRVGLCAIDRALSVRRMWTPTVFVPNVKVTEATWSDYLLYDRPRQKNIFIPSLFQKATFDNCIYEKQALHLFYENFDFYDWAKNRKVYIASFVYFYSPEDENDRFSVFRRYSYRRLPFEKDWE